MKKFIVMVLSVSVFFIGLGSLVEKVGAKYKSDERALALIRQAREVVGGEQAITAVRSMTITGKVTKTFDFDGNAKTVPGDWELNMELPNKFAKMMKLRHEDGDNGVKSETVNKQIDVIVMKKGDADNAALPPDGTKQKIVIIKKGDGDNAVFNSDDTSTETRKIIVNKDVRVAGAGAEFHRSDLARTTLALLLTAPEGVDVSYTYAGDGAVDGVNCDVINSQIGDANVKLYLDKSTHLPVMMNYQAMKPIVMKFDRNNAPNAEKTIMIPGKAEQETAEFQVKFSDYRAVNGLQLPFKWTQAMGGKDDEIVDVTSYEINPANIADKFNRAPEKVIVRTIKQQ